MRIVFVHTPMAEFSVPARHLFWRNFDIQYHAFHPGLRHMENNLWELPHWMHWLGGVLVDQGFTSLGTLDFYTSECALQGIDRSKENGLRSSRRRVPILPDDP
jgi:anaerobic magnesium-protoporphyrin IX monomethyl ester cyclase